MLQKFGLIILSYLDLQNLLLQHLLLVLLLSKILRPRQHQRARQAEDCHSNFVKWTIFNKY